MNPHGLSASDLRKRNRAGLLGLVHRNGAIARNDLASNIGLTRASVTILANELIEEGLLVEAGSSSGTGKAGRRKIYLRIRSEAAMLLGIGLESDRLQVLLTDLGGAVLGVRNLSVPRGIRSGNPGPLLAKLVSEATRELAGGRSAAEAGVIGG